MWRLRLANKFTLELNCNWKFLNENLTDIYHIAVLHSATFGPNQPLESYRYEVFDGGYHGRFVGGTGRFEGIEGDYELSFVLGTQPPGKIEAETVSMRGRWHIAQP